MKKALILAMATIMTVGMFAGCTSATTTQKISTLADLSGKKIVMQKESSAVDAFNASSIKATVKSATELPNNIDCFNEIKAGRADAMVVDEIVGKYYMTQNKDQFVALKDSLSAEVYAIAVKKGNTALRDRLNAALEAVVKSGKAADISKKWFSEDIVYWEGKDIPQVAQSTEKQTLILGLDDSFPPMGFKNEAGEIVGFDIDLAKAVAEVMNVELKFQPIDWNSKELELNSGKIDMIWNGLTVTTARSESMTLTQPYMKNNQIIIINKKDS